MKIERDILHNRLVSPDEYSRIPHMICLADFDTNRPNPNRINRIATEINEYLKYKHKNIEI